jgi:hypothetical protein
MNWMVVQEADLQLGVFTGAEVGRHGRGAGGGGGGHQPGQHHHYCDEVPYAAGVLAEGHAATLRRTGPASATVG